MISATRLTRLDYTGSVIGLSTVRILEAVRRTRFKAYFNHASSSEMFSVTPPPQDDFGFHSKTTFDKELKRIIE